MLNVKEGRPFAADVQLLLKKWGKNPGLNIFLDMNHYELAFSCIYSYFCKNEDLHFVHFFVG